MILSRVSVRSSSHRFITSTRTIRNITCRRSGRHIQKRSYATEGGAGGAHGAHKSGGDLPWAITSAVITIPSVWYLIQPQLDRLKNPKGHGHGEAHEHHAEAGKGDESEDGESEEAKPGGVGEDDQEEKGQQEDGDTEKSPASEENGAEEVKSEGEAGESEDLGSEDGQDTPETSDEEGSQDEPKILGAGGKVEGVKFKGSTSGGPKDGEQGDTRKRIPDAKGGYKKRIESHYGKVLGEAQTDEQHHANKDLAASSKPVGSRNTQSGKQEGISNTDTKHSIDITNDPEMSKKGEGMPETAKSKGTVDPHRPQV